MSNVAITPGVGATIATDNVGGVEMQRIKVDIGTAGNGVLWGSSALADAAANPTLPLIGSFIHTYNGTTWDRMRSPVALGDGNSLSGGTAVGSYNFNSATWDRRYNNSTGVALASAARTTATLSSSLTNFNGRGVMVYLNITAASGTGGLVTKILNTDPATAVNVQLNANPTAIIAVGMYAYEVYPGSSTAGTAGNGLVQQRTSAVLPRTFVISIGVGDASSYTYSVGYSIIL